ncbi:MULTISPECIES: TIGR03885 family FMN-dependent LLM class oxidoreductase [Methanobacterium]|uniref:TIGR03885 family FMN-dependent LLM class oxidoreductase n=1 Tax=Methanobacterium veterum TaxID=408577 RepID=A0A9E4ZTE2_9EURY|nr:MULTISPECIES: TIGR03885 family FMN-dependent LLM class oxidoreductase [Methanobacterium]MCZ3364561.1 TIGR03885 family FMN-dependent LLM class oxidoreductase [Methanobacterium veterum]MCZ3372315.1 TIGR03885 family FMN-dependent LLM class oxidoreductase [Methanobacterium veterum]
MIIGYHNSHEQFPPSKLLKFVQMAEKNGFNGASSSDHFYPWSESQGESGFVWSWLGSALQATSLPFGVVNAPGQRYHPTIIAQATATLTEMYPERFWIAVGSGQLLNESITGDKWPPKSIRNERLKESAKIIRKLWAGETVTHYGHVTVEGAKLYTRPENPPPLIGAAITPETAEWLGKWADGLITVAENPYKLGKIIKAFHRGGGKGKPAYIKLEVSYDPAEEKALKGAYGQWKSNIFESNVLTNLKSPEQFDNASKLIDPEVIRAKVNIFTDINEYVELLDEYIQLGVDHIYIHNVNLNQEQFIEDFGQKVLPFVMD